MMENRNFSSCTINIYQSDCFTSLSEEERRELDAHSVDIKYQKGEMLCKQGGFASYIFFIDKGLAKVYLDDGSNTLVLKIIPDGNLLGLTSLNERHTTFQYSAMAYVETEVRQIEINFFRKLLSQNPAFAKEIIDILAANSVQMSGRFFCLTCKQSYGRLADIILCLSNRVFKTGEFELPLSRKDLADLSGMGAETVIRMLKSFKEDGLIEMKGKIIKVLNPERLQKISETG